MAITFKFYSDAALTTEITAALAFSQASSSPTAVDKVVYFGSSAASKTARASSNPGVDQITVSIVDAASGTGSPATDVKIAATSGGLASATAGASLNIGTQVTSGSANAKAIHIRVLDSTGVVATNTDLSLQTNSIIES
ncbi:MAG: hypothetical protein KBE22_03190 [Candidatus Accumulibacter sp.]|nr:hypothetical protein [Accumulibacter sp.]